VPHRPRPGGRTQIGCSPTKSTAGLGFSRREQCWQPSIHCSGHRSAPTVLLITHHVEELLPQTRQVLLLKAGRAAAIGTPQQVIRSDRLSKVYGLPVRISRKAGRFWLQVHTSGWSAGATPLKPNIFARLAGLFEMVGQQRDITAAAPAPDSTTPKHLACAALISQKALQFHKRTKNRNLIPVQSCSPPASNSAVASRMRVFE